MKRIYTLLALLWACQLHAQQPTNAYAAVSGISNGTDCASLISVDDASPFAVGDQLLIIQMQGATINETNTAAFGDVTDIDGAGLYERCGVTAINGNQISVSPPLLNNYDMAGKVQVVNILQYTDLNLETDLSAMPWDGSKGGVLALEVTGTLTLNANISADGAGFRGGTRAVEDSNCTSFITESDYHYPLSNWRGEGKGEGIAALIAGKEAGRGAQANGGGGGNDHNSGGGGGAGYSPGGRGGEAQDPGFFDCKGFSPGEGGKAPPISSARLFMGGGGGAGHDNNNVGSDGAAGGGIIFLNAGTIDGNGFRVSADGGDAAATIGQDGGGGGGGGGTVILGLSNLMGTFTASANGGDGGDANVSNAERCKGPGGGGGGGVIYTDINAVTLTVDGGTPGVVVNSASSCNGSSNNGQNGAMGVVLSFMNLPVGNAESTSSTLTHNGCASDGYEIMVNGMAYNESNPQGVEVISNVAGCDSTITINLQFEAASEGSLQATLCANESLAVGGDIYNAANPSGSSTLPNAAYTGCDSIVQVDLTLLPESSSTQAMTICGGEPLPDPILLANGSYTGCDSIVYFDVTVLPNATSTIDPTLCPGESLLVNGVLFDESNPLGQEILADAAANGCDSLITVNLSFHPSMNISESVMDNEVTVNVSGSAGPYSYAWSNGATGMTNTLLESGAYSVTVTDGNGCEAAHSFDFTFVGIEELQADSPIRVHPNPVSGTLYFAQAQAPSTPWGIQVFDSRGRLLISTEWAAGNRFALDVSPLPAGVYSVVLRSDGAAFAKKIVVGN